MQFPQPGFPNVGLATAAMAPGMVTPSGWGAPRPTWQPTVQRPPVADPQQILRAQYPPSGLVVPAPGAPQSLMIPISPDTYEALVVGLANPFATRWIPAATIFTHQTDLTPREGALVHPGNSPETDRPEPNRWWHLVCQGSEAFFDEAAIDLATFDPWNLALNFGMPSTMLKIRIKLGLGWSKVRVLDVDVGAGVQLLLSSKWVNSVEVLVPDPSSVPPNLPEAIITAPRDFATLLRTRISCELAPAGGRSVYTQAFFLTDAVVFAVMPIVASARDVQIYAATPFPMGTTAQFVQIRDTPFIASVSAAPPSAFVPLGTIDTPTTSTETPRSLIPGNANAILISSGGGDTYNVVQELVIA